MILVDFECRHCNFIWEELIINNTIVFMECPICKSIARRLIATPRIANFKSGFKQVPILTDKDHELDPKKEDIFGRKYSELPDDNEIESKYHQEIEKYEQTTKKKADVDIQLDIMRKTFGDKRLKEKGVIQT